MHVMWITCGQHHEETPKTIQASKAHGSVPYLGGPLGGRRGARGSRLEQCIGAPQGSSKAMPGYADGRLCGPRRCHSRFSDVDDRTSGVRSIGKNPNGIHQGEESTLGTQMTITAAGPRDAPNVAMERPGNVREPQGTSVLC